MSGYPGSIFPIIKLGACDFIPTGLDIDSLLASIKTALTLDSTIETMINNPDDTIAFLLSRLDSSLNSQKSMILKYNTFISNINSEISLLANNSRYLALQTIIYK
jgi:hypothetical protein